jgi:hypothetical protein|tara:strand:- start:347 stop:478 length:132 start_codon:yes stop_codon:yes gene_type:complete
MGFLSSLWKDWGKGNNAGPITKKEVKKVTKKSVKKVKKTAKKK